MGTERTGDACTHAARPAARNACRQSRAAAAEDRLKPAPFTYHDPRSVREATEMLASLENARVLAGGQSLMPMMNFRFAMPDHLVDLNRIDALSYLRFNDDTLRIGAMTRQRDIEHSAEVARRCPVLHEALDRK